MQWEQGQRDAVWQQQMPDVPSTAGWQATHMYPYIQDADMTGEDRTLAPGMVVRTPNHARGAVSGVLAGTAAHVMSLSVLQSTRPWQR